MGNVRQNGSVHMNGVTLSNENCAPEKPNKSEENLADMVCSLDNKEACLACGS